MVHYYIIIICIYQGIYNININIIIIIFFNFDNKEVHYSTTIIYFDVNLSDKSIFQKNQRDRNYS